MVLDPSPANIRLGSAVLDLDRGTLSRNGRILPLRSKSFHLLCELARQSGRVVPKTELLDVVWKDVIVTEASLTQAVRDIRKIIEDEAGVVLRTVPRRGYMLCPSDTDTTSNDLKLAEGSLTTKPRIALLPLADRTGVPEQGPILEGLIEEVTAGLARFRSLTVVARHSAFAASVDQGLSLTEIAARLRADYIVDGTARLVDGRLVLAIALNDVRSGEILWGDSFACEGAGWLTLQDLIPRRIVQRLFTSIDDAGHRSGLRRREGNLSAFEHLARGRALFRSYESGVNEAALTHFAAAIAADPSLGVAHSYHALADAALHDYSLASLELKRRFRAQGVFGAHLSPEESRCHGILAYLHDLLAEFEPGEQAARKAVELNSCDADALYSLAMVMLDRGRPQDCLDYLLRAKDLNPMWPAYYDGQHSFALYHLGRYEESARLLNRVPRLSGRQEMRLAATYAQMGVPNLARLHVAKAQELAPDVDFLALARTSYAYEHERDRQALIAGIELALRIHNEGEDWVARDGLDGG